MTRPGPLDMPESYEEYLVEIGVRPSYIVQLGQKLRDAGFEIKSGYRTEAGPSGPGPWTRALHLAGGDRREAARIHEMILREEGPIPGFAPWAPLTPGTPQRIIRLVGGGPPGAYGSPEFVEYVDEDPAERARRWEAFSDHVAATTDLDPDDRLRSYHYYSPDWGSEKMVSALAGKVGGCEPYEMNLDALSLEPEGYYHWPRWRRRLWNVLARWRYGRGWREHVWPPVPMKVRVDDPVDDGYLYGGEVLESDLETGWRRR